MAKTEGSGEQAVAGSGGPGGRKAPQAQAQQPSVGVAKTEDKSGGQAAAGSGEPGGKKAPQGQDQQPSAAMKENRDLLKRFKNQPVKG